MRVRHWLLAAAVLGCSAEPGRERPAEQAGGQEAVGAPGVAADDLCPKTGAWRPCSVLDRLERAGLAPQAGDSVRHEFLSVPGVSYRVGGSALQVFLYADSTDRRRDMTALDSSRAAPAAAAVDWPARPTLIASNNLLAILLSDSERHIERVQLALTAGLPAP